MTIPASVNRWLYVASGGTSFPYTTKIHASTDLRVEVDDVLQSTGYSVTGVGADAGGNVVFSVAPSNGAVVVIMLRPDLSQALDYTGLGNQSPLSLEDQLDKTTNMLKGVLEQAQRAAKVPGSAGLTDFPFPDPGDHPTWFLRANSLGTGFELVQVVATGGGSVVLPLAVSDGGTGATTIAGILAALGLTAPIPVAAGGTGGITAAAARAALAAAPLAPQYVTLVADAELSNERALAVAGGKLTLADGGAGQAATLTAALPRSYLSGCGLTNNAGDATNDIDIAVGEARSDDNAENLILGSALTKRLDANWAVGTNQGGLDTGAVGNGVYHLWVIKRTDTGVVDVLFSLSATAPTMPANYTKKRRIGSILRAGGTILAFVQDGDLFQLKATVLDVNATNPGTSAVTRALASVPTGVNLEAFGNMTITCDASGGTGVRLSDLATNDEAASLTVAGLEICTTAASEVRSSPWRCRTDTSAQIRTRLRASFAGTILRMATQGWIDRRGRES